MNKKIYKIYDHYRKVYEWQNESERYGTICPYCGYELDDEEKIYDEGTHDVTCPFCNKIFELEASIILEWTSRKREVDFVEGEEDD